MFPRVHNTYNLSHKVEKMPNKQFKMLNVQMINEVKDDLRNKLREKT